MPNSARALGQDGLRLRSRRVRADRTPRLPAWLALALLIVAGLFVLVSPSVPDRNLRFSPISNAGWMPGPSAPPSPVSLNHLASLEQQRYLDALWPIHARLQQNVVRMGLLLSLARTEEIGRVDFERRLDDGLANYRRVEELVRSLEPPPELQDTHDRYLTAIRLFQQSTLEMLSAFGDGDTGQARAVPINLDALARLRVLSERLWPTA
jgi:hypothetical protein